jgi:hypothetical protein
VCPKDLADCVGEPGPRAADTSPKIPRVLMQESWKNGFRHIVSDEKIPIGGTVITAKPSAALSERPVVIHQLSLAREKSRKDKCAAIERIFGRHFELCRSGQQLVIREARGGSIVRDNSENSLVLRLLRLILRFTLTGGNGSDKRNSETKPDRDLTTVKSPSLYFLLVASFNEGANKSEPPRLLSSEELAQNGARRGTVPGPWSLARFVARAAPFALLGSRGPTLAKEKRRAGRFRSPVAMPG